MKPFDLKKKKQRKRETNASVKFKWGNIFFLPFSIWAKICYNKMKGKKYLENLVPSVV